MAETGLCADGEQEKLVADGATEIHGSIPVNTDGGLIANGEPIGASGLRQVHELVRQLRGEAGERQVPGARASAWRRCTGRPVPRRRPSCRCKSARLQMWQECMTLSGEGIDQLVAIVHVGDVTADFPPTATIGLGPDVPANDFGMKVYLLPYLEQSPTHDGLNFSDAHDRPSNLTATSTHLASFLCPSDGDRVARGRATGPDFGAGNYPNNLGTSPGLNAGKFDGPLTPSVRTRSGPPSR